MEFCRNSRRISGRRLSATIFKYFIFYKQIFRLSRIKLIKSLCARIVDLTANQLNELQSTIPNIDNRVDIKDINPNMSDPVSIRVEQYISQVKNPYAFKCGDVAVNLKFSTEGKTLKQAITSYLTSLKGNE